MQYPVITSQAAKDHMTMARTLMDEMKQGMMLQKQNIMAIEANQQVRFDEQKRFDQENQTKIQLEQMKNLL